MVAHFMDFLLLNIKSSTITLVFFLPKYFIYLFATKLYYLIVTAHLDHRFSVEQIFILHTFILYPLKQNFLFPWSEHYLLYGT